MTLIVAMAAFSIDVSQWYVGHHRAQVAADATALAAANCLANTVCTTTTATAGSDTETAGNRVADGNGFSDVTYSFPGSNTVKVTVNSTSPASFGGLFGIHAVNTSASATASYNTLQDSSSCTAMKGKSTCYSLFAGNDVCPSPQPTITSTSFDYVGLDLVTQDNGGGGATVSEVFSNAYFMSNAQSSASTFTVTTVGSGTPACTESPGKGNASYLYVPKALPYPEVWTEPTGSACTFSAASWTTASVAAKNSPGVYCVNATPTTACSNGASASGDIDVDLSSTSLAAGGYEFVGPCVTIAGWSSNGSRTNITGQPLVYGTSNIQTSDGTATGTPDLATTSKLPTCVKNDGTNLTSTFLDGAPTQGPVVYDQCGTAEITSNGGYTGFVEAWNISLDKNNAVIGTGPTSVSPGGGLPLPGGDALTG
jgi:hypothetical protein